MNDHHRPHRPTLVSCLSAGWRLATIALIGILMSGCGDSTEAFGELGNIRYQLHTDYELPDKELTELHLITGHRHEVRTDLVGFSKASWAPGAVQHHLLANPDASLQNKADTADVPDFRITAYSPGAVTVEARKGPHVIDRISLTFEDPAEIQVIPRVREPFSSQFVSVTTGVPTTVQEGAQITFVAVPMGASGQRLIGDLYTDVQLEPARRGLSGQ